MLSHAKIKKEVIKTLGKLVQKEMTTLSKGTTLHGLSDDALRSFSWKKLTSELESVAPNLYSLLKTFVMKKKRKTSKKMSKKGKSYVVDDETVVGLCAAILLRHRSQRMNLVQRLVSVLLYCGHAPKKVLHS